jgi:hypothetical protein
MTKLAYPLAALVLASCAATSSQPAPIKGTAPAPPVASCATEGPALFRRSSSSNNAPTRTTVIYLTGAWTTDEENPALAGCLTADQLAQLEEKLTAAPFTVTRAEFKCMAEDPFETATSYEVRGQPVWTRVMCGYSILDGVSARVLVDVDQMITNVTDAKLGRPSL